MLCLNSCPSIPETSVVDTTGAGDGYIGGFIAGLLRGGSIEASHGILTHRYYIIYWYLDEQLCMILGTAVASEKLKKLGARTALPTFAQIEDIYFSASKLCDDQK